jgi:hypothetical protein
MQNEKLLHLQIAIDVYVHNRSIVNSNYRSCHTTFTCPIIMIKMENNHTLDLNVVFFSPTIFPLFPTIFKYFPDPLKYFPDPLKYFPQNLLLPYVLYSEPTQHLPVRVYNMNVPPPPRTLPHPARWPAPPGPVASPTRPHPAPSCPVARPARPRLARWPARPGPATRPARPVQALPARSQSGSGRPAGRNTPPKRHEKPKRRETPKRRENPKRLETSKAPPVDTMRHSFLASRVLNCNLAMYNSAIRS